MSSCCPMNRNSAPSAISTISTSIAYAITVRTMYTASDDMSGGRRGALPQRTGTLLAPQQPAREQQWWQVDPPHAEAASGRVLLDPDLRRRDQVRIDEIGKDCESDSRKSALARSQLRHWH